MFQKNKLPLALEWNIEAEGSSIILIIIYQTIRYHSPEGRMWIFAASKQLSLHCNENPSYLILRIWRCMILNTDFVNILWPTCHWYLYVIFQRMLYLKNTWILCTSESTYSEIGFSWSKPYSNKGISYLLQQWYVHRNIIIESAVNLLTTWMIICLSKRAIFHGVGSVWVCFVIFKDALYWQRLLLRLENRRKLHYIFLCDV
jgi:hypothetical protein